MRTVGVVTVARSDYGIYVPLLRKIAADRALRLHLIVSGGHLWKGQGFTVREIERDGFRVGDAVRTAYRSDRPEGIAQVLGEEVAAFGRSFARRRPDLLVVLGDRFEMFAAALAALPFKIPVAHLHGGELTQGAIDDALRHGMTKLSHLHFPSTEAYARRIRQLGEEPWRIRVAGALSLEGFRSAPRMPRRDLEMRWGLSLERPFLLATFHPATLQFEQADRQAVEFLEAIRRSGMPTVFTLPNADTGSSAIAKRIRAYVAGRPGSALVDSLGREGYFGMMNLAAAMVGNSSSGILEAPSFRLPVVNVGDRQAGRLRARNVIDVPCRRAKILAAIRLAVGPAFRRRLRGLRNPYERRGTADVILRTLKRVALDDRLIVKRFADLGTER